MAMNILQIVHEQTIRNPKQPYVTYENESHIWN